MVKIQRFDRFNEWFNFFGSDSRPYDSKLREYGLDRESIDDQTMNFYHGCNLVATIMLDEENFSSRPDWILTIYFYERETPPKAGFNFTKPPKIKNQKDQPYGSMQKSMGPDSEDAVLSFINWWKKYTRSGRNRNPLYKI